MMDEEFDSLVGFLQRVPAVGSPVGHGSSNDGRWWVKLTIDIDDELAWRVIQEFAHVLNYLSLEDQLPSTFKPVSPPPYMNGGPNEFLSWLIEAPASLLTPSRCAEWLSGRLPDPVDSREEWLID